MNRRTLPLLLAVLLATAGCVSVAPVDNKPPQDRTKASVPAPAAQRETGGALPLTPLPDSRPPAPAVVIAPEENPSAVPPRREQPRTTKADGSGTGARTVRQRVKAKQSSPQRPASKAKVKAKVKAKPRKVRTSKPAVPQRSRPAAVPAPGRVSMAELCRSSHGVTSPAITQLCHGTYR
ncbi:hypothetical protein [Streptomyces sp. NBC_01244]|uniref:hypothetical protein n=1 Tax=Streptomyces sp. NBC_01244 TaxID=2903797 RepID=UPI002E10B80D|nr:hypothetical protein OG247_42265 [Streptomyces sp. NBC_01244]